MNSNNSNFNFGGNPTPQQNQFTQQNTFGNSQITQGQGQYQHPFNISTLQQDQTNPNQQSFSQSQNWQPPLSQSNIQNPIQQNPLTNNLNNQTNQPIGSNPSHTSSQSLLRDPSQQLMVSDLNQSTQQKQINQTNPPLINNSQSAEQCLTLIFEGLKHFLVINGGNIVRNFREMDSQQDGIISREDLMNVLFIMNTSELYEVTHIEAIYSLLDQNNSNQINYMEFCKRFFDYANQKQIKESSDTVFQVFESIRKYVKIQKKSLASLFASQLINNQKQKEFYLDFQTFKEHLRFAQIKFDMTMEQRLFIRLDKAKNSKVDFFHLADLLGYEQEDLNQMGISQSNFQTNQFSNSQSQFNTNNNQQMQINQQQNQNQNNFLNTQNQFGGLQNSRPQTGLSRPQTGFQDSMMGQRQGGPPGLHDTQSMFRTGMNQHFQTMGIGKDNKRYFFRKFCRHIKVNGVTPKFISEQIGAYAVNNIEVPLASFSNYILSYCNGGELQNKKDIVDNIARQFDVGHTNNVRYIDFCNKLQFEMEKLAYLEQFYWKCKESLDFRASYNLYDLLQVFDEKRDKRFNNNEIIRMVQSRGMTASEIELSYLQDEYDQKKLNFIDYNELEKDYLDFLDYFNLHRVSKNQIPYNLGQILQMMNQYVNQSGKGLREIFKKTRIGESDLIQKFEFSKIMTEISFGQLDSESIDRLAQELDQEGKNSVSFTELLKRYNEFFGIRDDSQKLQQQQLSQQKVLWHIAKIAFEQKGKFYLERHFQVPSCNTQQFVGDLERDPLFCHRQVTKEQLQELAESFQHGMLVNTEVFLQEIKEKFKKFSVKHQIFKNLKQHLTLRGSSIEEIFKNIKGLGKYKDENLLPEEFQAVFLSVEFPIEKNQLWDIFDTMNKDGDGKISYLDFVREYKEIYESKTGKEGGIQGIKYFQNTSSIFQHIGSSIEKKGFSKNLGNYLAGYDIHGTGKIERNAFYRVIESMNFGLGEGDIQLLIKNYDSLNQNQIDLQSFIDDLNIYIIDNGSKVQLRSQINQTVGERIVEPITPTPKTLFGKNFQGSTLNIKIIKEIMCWLYSQGKDYKDLITTFNVIQSAIAGHLSKNEFFNALDMFQIDINENDKQQFFDNLLQKQDQTLEQKTQNINIELFIQFMTNDFSKNKEQLINEILFEIAEKLTESKVPIRDNFLMFDQPQNGFVLRDVFIGQILQNYLGLSSILSRNKSSLLLQRYDPQSSFRIYYDSFIQDLQKIEIENPKGIKLYMSQIQLDHDTQNQEQLTQNQQQFQQEMVNAQNEKEIFQEAKSKKNTLVTETDIINRFNLPIPAYELEDIMIATAKKGKTVEQYFKQFGHYQNGKFVLTLEEFFESCKKLSIKWVDKQKISELFIAIDLGAHQQSQNYLTIDDIGMAVLQTATVSIEDIQAKYVQEIYNQLKQKQLLPKLRDILNFFNTRRDNTCLSKDFKSTLLDQLGLSKVNINESQIDLLIQKYRYSTLDSTRIIFTKFLKDIELWDKGISPALSWATDFSEDIIKALVIFNYNSLDSFFAKYSRLQGIILFDEFQIAMNDLQIGLYHNELEQMSFFNNIEQMANRVSLTSTQTISKVNLSSLIDTIKKLCPKTPLQISQDIVEKIFVSSKSMNISIQVYHIFNEYDQNPKSGQVNLDEFKSAIQNKLNGKNIKNIDLDFLGQKYKAQSIGSSSQTRGIMVQYEKFLQDYEKIERLGLRAADDPLKKQTNEQQQQQQILRIQEQKKLELIELPQGAKDLFKNMGSHLKIQNMVEKLCDELVKKDIEKTQFLTDQEIWEVFASSLNIKLSRNKQNSQMYYLLLGLPQGPIKGQYSYVVMLEYLFGKEILPELSRKYQLKLLNTQSQLRQEGGEMSFQQQALENNKLIMQQSFKDQIELKLIQLKSYVQQISKGVWLLREQEFYIVFNKAGITRNQSDLELLQLFFRRNFNKQNQALDFRLFLQNYQISELPSQILLEMQNEIKNKSIDMSLFFIEDIVTFEIFNKALQNAKINLQLYSDDQIHQLFIQMNPNQDKNQIDKNELIRLLEGQTTKLQQQQEQQIPYIVNELVYYIVNHNIDIFKTISPQSKIISTSQFQQLLQLIGFKSTKPKEIDSLFIFLKSESQQPVEQKSETQISIEKLVITIRKIDPQYASLITGYNQSSLVNNTSKKIQNQPTQANKNVKIAQNQLSQFNQKISQTLIKINTSLKKNNIALPQFYKQIDKNSNGLIEKQEFVEYFTIELKVESFFRNDMELLFDTLDTNKDGFLSLNEFCLYIDGAQQTLEQRLKNIDSVLEKELKDEIDVLFKFFDKNGDGKISVEEVQQALKSVNQTITQKEAKEMVNIADKNQNGFLEKLEFYDLLLPKLKEEIIFNENNLDELRRLFKEADHDSSGYLNKIELQQTLLKAGVELTEIQVDQLMSEFDLDENQSVDIDEFIAYLALADQLKFRNPQSKTVLINIRRSRKLHPIDFFNCFRNLSQCFLPSFTQPLLEQKYIHTPSYGIYPQYDTASMTYKGLSKLGDLQKFSNNKVFIEHYGPSLNHNQIGCEIQLEEVTGVPLPKKEDFDWNKIINREVRIILYDTQSQEYLSNMFIIQANWKEEFPLKWLFSSANQNHRNLIVKAEIMNKIKNTQQTLGRDIHLLIELVLYTIDQDQLRQISCGWGSIPIMSFDKVSKQKVTLKYGSPHEQMNVDSQGLFQHKKTGAFSFLKKTVASNLEFYLLLNVKPCAKFSEQTLLYMSMIPESCIVPKRLLSFIAAFRLYCYKKLIKSEQQMVIPQGSIAIAQFKKIYDNPDSNLIIGDCWDIEVNQISTQLSMDQIVLKMEDYLQKMYSIIYNTDYSFDHVYPTRSTSIDSEIFNKRDQLVKQVLIPGKSKTQKNKSRSVSRGGAPQGKQQEKIVEQILYSENYKPFTIQEMEIDMNGLNQFEAKQEEILKMYMQMGLLQ